MKSSESGLARSYLYVPAVAGDRMARAASRGADAVIADLEDSVPPSRKAEALAAAVAWLREPRDAVERWVRVNPGEKGLEELAELAALRPDGFCLPKCAGSADVERVAALIDDLQDPARQRPTTMLMPLVESASGVLAAAQIAASRRVLRLQIGEIDLATDLGLAVSDDGAELGSVRNAVVVASAAAGILPPVGAVSPQFRDLAGFGRSTAALRRAGFVGRAAIHPDQIRVIHDAYAVSADERDRAARLVAQYEAALMAGSGVLVGDDGRMVDEAVIRTSRRTIALADAAERRPR